MTKFRTDFRKFGLILSLFVFSIKRCSAESQSLRVYDFVSFEQMKNDIFTKSGEKMLHYSNNSNDFNCLKELNAIGISANEFELWAAKIVDSWGKLPSGILDGNLFDIGSFSQCFHIDRNGELYKTMYCLGQIVLRLERPLMSNSSITITQLGNETTLTFGICVPADCSMDFLQNYFNQISNKKDSIKLLENSCQVQENSINFTVLDWIAVGFLAVIVILILTSTAYDVLCPSNKRKKSEVLLAFSFYSNGKKLLSYESPKSTDVIRCLDGIRVITTQWILFGHVFYTYFRILPNRNSDYYIETFLSRYINMILLSFVIGVDTFFVLSGLLVTINTLKHLEKTKGRINVPMLYIHRYLRLTPLLAVTILLTMSLTRFLGNGPLWPGAFNELKEACDRKWWLSLLYIQNYVDPDYTCIPPAWYLSVDMQLFVISPLIIYLIYRFNKKTICALVILVFGCIGCTIAIHLKYGFRSIWNSDGNVYALSYEPTHTRYSSWLIGVIGGYIFYKTRNRTFHIPRILNVVAWMISLAIMNAIVFGMYPLVQVDSTSTSFENGLYVALSRVGWSIALVYIIFACYHNYGGPINTFLGHPLWQPISRLSYSIYILQYPIIYVTMMTTKDSIYATELTCFLTAVGNYVLIVFISLIATLAFEIPANVIEKSVFLPKKA